MFELLYTSVCPQGLSESELMDILVKARVKNKGLGITGMLVYHAREIIQIIEGEESKVQELFQTICDDSRHTSVGVFYQGKIAERAFSNWSMAFKLLDESMIQKIKADYQGLNKWESPVGMIKDSRNRGQQVFLSLRDTL